MLSSMIVYVLFSHLHSKVGILCIINDVVSFAQHHVGKNCGNRNDTPGLFDSRDCASNHCTNQPPALKVAFHFVKW